MSRSDGLPDVDGAREAARRGDWAEAWDRLGPFGVRAIAARVSTTRARYRTTRDIARRHELHLWLVARCEACGGGGPLVFDHDHVTGVYRGALCSPCNLTLGQSRDSGARLRALAQYLETTTGRGQGLGVEAVRASGSTETPGLNEAGPGSSDRGRV